MYGNNLYLLSHKKSFLLTSNNDLEVISIICAKENFIFLLTEIYIRIITFTISDFKEIIFSVFFTRLFLSFFFSLRKLFLQVAFPCIAPKFENIDVLTEFVKSVLYVLE